MKAAALAFVLALVGAASARAAVAWHAEARASHLNWTVHWRQAAVRGEFKRFSVLARLDASSLAGGELTVTVETASVATASPDISHAIRDSTWFDVKQYPRAFFKTSSIRQRAGGTLAITGILHLKGHEKQLSFPMRLERQGKRLVLTGTLRLNRGDFAVGTGQWSGGSLIARDVAVAFKVTLVRSD